MRYISLLVLIAAVGCGRDDADKKARADSERVQEAVEAAKKEEKTIAKIRDADKAIADLQIAELKRENDELKKKLTDAEVKYRNELDKVVAPVKPPAKPKDPAAMVECADFVDHADKYKGKEVEFTLVPADYFINGKKVFEGYGESVRFELFGHKVKGSVTLKTIAGMPRVGFGEPMVIKFLCSDGRVDVGNSIISARRASADDITLAKQR